MPTPRQDPSRDANVSTEVRLGLADGINGPVGSLASLQTSMLRRQTLMPNARAFAHPPAALDATRAS
jgi:hypothetical protein